MKKYKKSINTVQPRVINVDITATGLKYLASVYYLGDTAQYKNNDIITIIISNDYGIPILQCNYRIKLTRFIVKQWRKYFLIIMRNG